MMKILVSLENIKSILSDLFSKTPTKEEVNQKIESVKVDIDEKIKNIDTKNLLTKDMYDTDDDGIVDKAKKIYGIEESSLFSVYGKSPTGEEGFYEFPIGTIYDNTNKFQSVRQDVIANEVYIIDLINKNKQNNLIVQCYEFKEGEQDHTTTLRTFNNTDEDNFYYNSDEIEFKNGMKIKNNYIIANSLNSDYFYESEVINRSDYLEILKIGGE